ncbi:MAG: hypothetical protein ABEI52_00700 [Halobacteriaceae archaeon]
MLSRRAVLSTLLAVMTGTAGCSRLESSRPTNTTSDSITTKSKSIVYSLERESVVITLGTLQESQGDLFIPGTLHNGTSTQVLYVRLRIELVNPDGHALLQWRGGVLGADPHSTDEFRIWIRRDETSTAEAVGYRASIIDVLFE